jgi:hypothetical protein
VTGADLEQRNRHFLMSSFPAKITSFALGRSLDLYGEFSEGEMKTLM